MSHDTKETGANPANTTNTASSVYPFIYNTYLTWNVRSTDIAQVLSVDPSGEVSIQPQSESSSYVQGWDVLVDYSSSGDQQYSYYIKLNSSNPKPYLIWDGSKIVMSNSPSLEYPWQIDLQMFISTMESPARWLSYTPSTPQYICVSPVPDCQPWHFTPQPMPTSSNEPIETIYIAPPPTINSQLSGDRVVSANLITNSNQVTLETPSSKHYEHQCWYYSTTPHLTSQLASSASVNSEGINRSPFQSETGVLSLATLEPSTASLIPVLCWSEGSDVVTEGFKTLSAARNQPGALWSVTPSLVISTPPGYLVADDSQTVTVTDRYDRPNWGLKREIKIGS